MTPDLVSEGKAIAERLNAEARAKALAGDCSLISLDQQHELSNALDSSLRDPYAGLPPSTDEPPDVDPGARTSTADDQQPVSLLTGAYTAADLQHMVFPPLRKFVPGLITEGFGVLVGGPKIGKSWMALNIALGCAHGGRVLGKIKVQKCDVLYLALEDGKRRIQDRVTKLEHGNGQLEIVGDGWPENLTFLNMVEGNAILSTLTEWYARHPRSLVILDTLSKNRPQVRAGANAYLADYEFGSSLKHVVDKSPESALLAVHHDRKQKSDDFVDNSSGTNGLTGAMDYMLFLSRKRQSNDGAISVTGRDIDEAEYAVCTDDGNWTLVGDTLTDAALAAERAAEERRHSRLGDRSLDAVKFVGSRATTAPSDLAAHLRIDNKLAGNLLADLHAGGYIDKRSRGTYSPLPTGESGESGESAGHSHANDSILKKESGESGENAGQQH